MADATFQRDTTNFNMTATGAYGAGEVIQLADGRAGVAPITGVTSGDGTVFQTEGVFRLTKVTGRVLLHGDPVYWDHSADNATYTKVNDRDFFVGICQEDTTSTQLHVDVALNVPEVRDIDVFRDPVLSVFVGTQGLNTMGIFRRGGCANFILSS